MLRKAVNIKAVVCVAGQGHMYYPNQYFKFTNTEGSLGPVFGYEVGEQVLIHIENLLEGSAYAKASTIGLRAEENAAPEQHA